jgi:hypothetical protein
VEACPALPPVSPPLDLALLQPPPQIAGTLGRLAMCAVAGAAGSGRRQLGGHVPTPALGWIAAGRPSRGSRKGPSLFKNLSSKRAARCWRTQIVYGRALGEVPWGVFPLVPRKCALKRFVPEMFDR